MSTTQYYFKYLLYCWNWDASAKLSMTRGLANMRTKILTFEYLYLLISMSKLNSFPHVGRRRFWWSILGDDGCLLIIGHDAGPWLIRPAAVAAPRENDLVSFKRIYSQFKHLKLSSFGVWENFYINTQYFLYTRLSHLSDLYNISPAFTKLSYGKISTS